MMKIVLVDAVAAFLKKYQLGTNIKISMYVIKAFCELRTNRKIIHNRNEEHCIKVESSFKMVTFHLNNFLSYKNSHSTRSCNIK